jgi:SAM-dependent methyltransferase
MAIIFEIAKFLLEAKEQGVSFSNIATIGRQNLYLNPKSLGYLARFCGLENIHQEIASDLYSDRFFNMYLCAKHVSAIDYSSYEGATIIHDMNKSIGENLEQVFDVVIDGGALEHIFNFPVAIENCMKMLKIGGRLFMFTPANNQVGHGFYQFSPELFFRVFDPVNGFEVERMEALEFRFANAELGSFGPIYKVIDPAIKGCRGIIINQHPLGLFLQVKKIKHLKYPFTEFPHQSDYIETWKTPITISKVGKPSANKPLETLKHLAEIFLPKNTMRALINRYKNKFIYSLRNRNLFIPK